VPSQLLTDALVRNLARHPKKQVDHYDNKIRGFGVRVSPQGTKSFFVWYRVGDDGRRLTLGRYPTMSLAEGRKRAQQALLEVASGKDPAAEKQRARAAYSGGLFGPLVDDFIENHAKRKTRLWADTERLLRREFVSYWEKWPAKDVSRRDVTKVLSAIVNRGSPSTANHALAVVRKMFNWAVEQGHLERSPCVGLGMPAQVISRDRILSDGELARVWKAADEMGYPFGPMIQLLILTAQRRGEVVGLRWWEINTKALEWTLPKRPDQVGPYPRRAAQRGSG
jgi:hypothetical protein